LDLTTELVRLLRSQRHVEVAVELARTADETTETALKLLR
jgi:flagellar basal body rod protein FlgG